MVEAVLEGWCLADLGVPTQAMRDARLRVDDPGAKVTLAAKEEWHESAIAFLRQAKEEDDNEAAPKQRKLQRLAAHDWLHAIDHQVQALTGWGLSAYLPEQPQHEPDQEPDQDPGAQPATHPAPVLVPIEKRMLLSISLDQCGIGMCSMMYMIYKRGMRILPFFDPFHRQARDTWNAFKEAGIKTSLLLAGITYNLSRGPWAGAAWWQQVKEAAKDMMQTVTEDDILVSYFYPRILADKGVPFGSISVEELLQTISEADWLQVKGPRMNPSRWWSEFDCGDFYIPSTNERLLVLLFLGLQQGWMCSAGAAGAQMKRLCGTTRVLPPDRKATTAEGNESMARLRDRCSEADVS